MRIAPAHAEQSSAQAVNTVYRCWQVRLGSSRWGSMLFIGYMEITPRPVQGRCQGHHGATARGLPHASTALHVLLSISGPRHARPQSFAIRPSMACVVQRSRAGPAPKAASQSPRPLPCIPREKQRDIAASWACFAEGLCPLALVTFGGLGCSRSGLSCSTISTLTVVRASDTSAPLAVRSQRVQGKRRRNLGGAPRHLSLWE